MKIQIKKIFLFALFISLWLLSSSCSIIGLAVGAKMQSDSNKRVNLEAKEITQIDKGEKVEIKTKTHDSVYGKYIGLKRKKQEQYESEYRQFFYSFQYVLPDINDSILVYDRNGFLQKEVFKGFDFNWLYVSAGEGGNLYPLKYDIIHYVRDKRGNTISPQSIENHIQHGNLPLYSRIIVETPERDELVDFYDISSVGITEKKENAALDGFALGLAVDALVVFILFESNPPLEDMDLQF